MSTPAPAHTADSAWTSLEPYAQLLRALLPRMSHLSVFNARGELHWSSEMAVGPELTPMIPQTLRAAEHESARHRRAGTARQRAGVPVLAAARRYRGGQRRRRSRSWRSASPAGGEGERRSFSFVQCAGQARDRVPAARADGARRDPDSAQLAAGAGRRSGDAAVGLRRRQGPASRGDLATSRQSSTSATEHLKAGLSALIIPENGIALVQALEHVRRSRPRCSPRRTAICCRWRRCAARP